MNIFTIINDLSVSKSGPKKRINRLVLYLFVLVLTPISVYGVILFKVYGNPLFYLGLIACVGWWTGVVLILRRVIKPWLRTTVLYGGFGLGLCVLVIMSLSISKSAYLLPWIFMITPIYYVLVWDISQLTKPIFQPRSKH
jgi:hypothetical protein